MDIVPAWIGLGSNLDDPPAQVRRALASLSAQTGIAVQAISPCYGSPPLGPSDQPDYVNAVARIGTSLAPDALLDVLQAIEQQQGRRRGRRWGERTLDLDLLLYDDRNIHTERLVVPHPGLATRRFVLQPLLDINPTLQLPDGTPLQRLLTECKAPPLTRLADTAAN